MICQTSCSCIHVVTFDTMIYDFFNRTFLWSFRLPGEAQKIDRMMECFASRYCELNPGVFVSTGLFFSVSYFICFTKIILIKKGIKNIVFDKLNYYMYVHP